MADWIDVLAGSVVAWLLADVAYKLVNFMDRIRWWYQEIKNPPIPLEPVDPKPMQVELVLKQDSGNPGPKRVV